MQRPEDVKLSREEGDALIQRLERNALSAADRHVLAQVVRLYFWLLFTLSASIIGSATWLSSDLSKMNDSPPHRG